MSNIERGKSVCVSLSAAERAIESESSRRPGQNVMFQTSVIVEKEEVTNHYHLGLAPHYLSVCAGGAASTLFSYPANQ